MHKQMMTPIALAVGAALALSGCSHTSSQNSSTDRKSVV